MWSVRGEIAGYHLFRSLSVRSLRAGSINRLWDGSYASSVSHFVIGDVNIDTIIDEYPDSGASLVFYWLLVQDGVGNLTVVDHLRVRPADSMTRARNHVTLTPRRRVIEIPLDPAIHHAAPTSPQHYSVPDNAVVESATPAPASRDVHFLRYEAPQTFAFETDGTTVEAYEVYLGPEIPESETVIDAMWDGHLPPGNSLERYTLPGVVEGFADKRSPAGQTTFLAVFAVYPDGTRAQPRVTIPTRPPKAIAELT
jgi:hypothetical protein